MIAGFEPLDILQSIVMILRQLAEGRCEVENQYKRVVPYEGNLRALEVMAEVFELRPHFEWRGLGFISHSGLKLSDAYADLDAELRFSVPGVRVADPKACQCGEVLKGVIKPWECKVFGTACTPERADRHVHGLVRGRMRRVLQLRPVRARARGGVMADPVDDLASASRRCWDSIENVRATPAAVPRRRRSRWPTAPAARRPRRWSKGCSCRRSAAERARARWPTPGAVAVDGVGSRSRPTPSSSSRCASPAARSASSP